jgi:5-formyltetrahydrofolate cyclo-ligase
MLKSAAAPSTKAALRVQALSRRERLRPDERAGASSVIAARAIALISERRPACVAAYLAIGSECDPRQVIEAADKRGIPIALPAVLDATTMAFRRHRPGEALVSGRFGVLSPGDRAAVVDPDLLIMPLVAFDRTGARLGYGRGFYDRAIAGLRQRGVRPILVGVAFAAQEVADIPVEPHDVRLDFVVTEEATLTSPASG